MSIAHKARMFFLKSKSDYVMSLFKALMVSPAIKKKFKFMSHITCETVDG